MDDLSKTVHFSYTNHHGEQATRHVTPKRIFHGTSQWHHEPQWLLEGYDHIKNADRTYSMQDINNWVE